MPYTSSFSYHCSTRSCSSRQSPLPSLSEVVQTQLPFLLRNPARHAACMLVALPNFRSQ